MKSTKHSKSKVKLDLNDLTALRDYAVSVGTLYEWSEIMLDWASECEAEVRRLQKKYEP